MMYLTRLSLNHTRIAIQWAANPYRVHQRLKMGCEGDPRLLFRIEETALGAYILAQTHHAPSWSMAFDDFMVLDGPPEMKSFELKLQAGRAYQFRLLANPSVKKTVSGEDQEEKKTRLGLVSEEAQLAWLRRKLEAAGAEVVSVQAASRGLTRSSKNPAKDEHTQTHLSVLFEGVLLAKEPEMLEQAVRQGIGPAKGYGFGLLSLAAARGD